MERPEDERSIHEDRPVCDMLPGTNSTQGRVESLSGRCRCRHNVPSPEPKCTEPEVISQGPFLSQPTLRVKPLGVWEDVWIIRNRPR
jgi:hypothetical protein